MQAIEAEEKEFLEIIKVKRLKKIIERYKQVGFCGILPCQELSQLLKSA